MSNYEIGLDVYLLGLLSLRVRGPSWLGLGTPISWLGSGTQATWLGLGTQKPWLGLGTRSCG